MIIRSSCAPKANEATIGGALGLLLLLVLAACGHDELRLTNRLDKSVRLDVYAPRVDLLGGCDKDFRTRFCVEEFEPIGVIDVRAQEERLVTLFDPRSSDQCTNVMWMRVLRLGDSDPVVDRGTSIQLPALIEIEKGAGALHGVAFPGETIRIDERGEADLNQGPPPETCEALNRPAR